MPGATRLALVASVVAWWVAVARARRRAAHKKVKGKPQGGVDEGASGVGNGSEGALFNTRRWGHTAHLVALGR